MSASPGSVGLDAAAAGEAGVVVIRPRRGWAAPELTKLLRYRDLLWYLALRDVQVRYKQTLLGAAWAVLQPVVTMVVLAAFFGRFLGVAQAAGDAPYPIFLYAGLLPWTFFAAAVNAASGSLVANASMLRKVYFPRLVVPVASLGAPLVDYAAASGVLVVLMAWYGVAPTRSLALVPPLVASTVLAALGVGVLLSALTAAYRDFRYVVAFLLQVWFFVTPVIYPSTIVPERFRPLLLLNPMHGTIEAFRAAILGQPVDFGSWAVAVVVSVVALTAGLLYFARTERRLADVV